MFGMTKKKMPSTKIPKKLVINICIIVFGWQRFSNPNTESWYLISVKENIQIVTKTSHSLLEVIANDSVLLSSLHIFQDIL